MSRVTNSGHFYFLKLTHVIFLKLTDYPSVSQTKMQNAKLTDSIKITHLAELLQLQRRISLIIIKLWQQPTSKMIVGPFTSHQNQKHSLRDIYFL